MTTLDAPDTTHTPADLKEADLLGLLAAYQYLQGQNLQVATYLSETLHISPTDLRVLLFMYAATDGVSPKDLARKLHHTTGSVTVLIDRLEQAGYMERRKHPSDRRAQTLHLTDTGIHVVHHVRDTYRTAFDGIFTGHDLHTAARTLRALGDALHFTLLATTL